MPPTTIAFMVLEMAEARGRVMVRPWRVGLVIDTQSPAEVREAIANLSSVWGGVSMPIFDRKMDIDQLERVARKFDVDSLYSEITEGELEEFLRKPGWVWRGRAQWGPFGDSDGGLRKGLLPIREFFSPDFDLVLPSWSADDPADLVLAATWGLTDKLGIASESVPYGELASEGRSDVAHLGLLNSTMIHINMAPSRPRTAAEGIHIIRPDHPQDVVNFWNARAYGDHAVGIPADGDPELIRFLLSQPLPTHTWTIGGREQRRVLPAIGLENASPTVSQLVSSAAEVNKLSIESGLAETVPFYLFPGLETSFTRSFRVDFRPDAHGVEIDLPKVPLIEEADVHSFARGAVAVEIRIQSVHGQDPRFTAQLPPYRRHAALLEHPGSLNADRFRSGYQGIVLGLDAKAEEARIPFALNVDVMRLLFDDTSARVEMSEVGRFQTRAAEKFGGPYSGIFNQPGIRAAIKLAADRVTGITLPQLRNEVESKREGWPGEMSGNLSGRDYAIDSVNQLFSSGLFVPTLKVHCSHCRVETHVSVDDLSSTIQCEFCGQTYNLALSHALTKPEWRYRLAAHLRSDQVGALLPALATTSLLQQLRPSTRAPSSLVLGLQLKLEGRTVETDIAAYFGDGDWAVVLGEVKTGNRIDAKDVANLEFLRNKLHAKTVRCLLLFTTLKDQFSQEETTELRGLVERSSFVETAAGRSVPNFPLVLTGPDLSRSFWDEDHPWRWDKEYYAGIFDAAIVSCKRNLGLIDFSPSYDADGPAFTFRWES